jgi:rhodanese/phosphatase family protein
VNSVMRVLRKKKQTELLGMHFVLIPGDGWSPPTDKQVAEFFAIIAQRPERTVFIHCWLGGDRTGVFIAAYRIAFDHWTAEHALEEMHAFHFKSFWHPAMKNYVQEFPKRLATSPARAPYRSPEDHRAAWSPVMHFSHPTVPVPTYSSPCDSCFIPQHFPLLYPS